MGRVRARVSASLLLAAATAAATAADADAGTGYGNQYQPEVCVFPQIPKKDGIWYINNVEREMRLGKGKNVSSSARNKTMCMLRAERNVRLAQAFEAGPRKKKETRYSSVGGREER